MTIKLTKENLKKLAKKMKDADPELMAESATHRSSAIAEFGDVFAVFQHGVYCC